MTHHLHLHHLHRIRGDQCLPIRLMVCTNNPPPPPVAKTKEKTIEGLLEDLEDLEDSSEDCDDDSEKDL